MATKFLTYEYGADLLAFLRDLGPLPTRAAELRDRLDALNARWPESAGNAATWAERLRIARIFEAYAAAPDAAAHRKLAGLVAAELRRRAAHRKAFADQVGIPTGRLSQLLNCYVRWLPAEAEVVTTALRLTNPIPVAQASLSLPIPPAPVAPAVLSRAADDALAAKVALLRAARALAIGHLRAALSEGHGEDHVRAALSALEGVP